MDVSNMKSMQVKMDDGTKKFNKKLIRGTDDKIVFITTHQSWIGA